METHLTLKSLPKYMLGFQRHVNQCNAENNQMESNDVPLIYANTFGFESFEDLEAWLFVRDVSAGRLTEEEMLEYAKKSFLIAKVSVEKDYLTIDELESVMPKQLLDTLYQYQY